MRLTLRFLGNVESEDRTIQIARALGQEVRRSPASAGADRLPYAGGATADFPFVAVGVLEEEGVVAGRVFVAIFQALDLLRAGLADDRPEPVDFLFRIRPEGEAGGVAAVAWFLVEADEGTRFAVALGGRGDFGL